MADGKLRLPKSRINGQPAHRRSPKQEREVAVRLNAGLTPRSGAGKIKGDVRKRGVLRIECKTTQHKSFSVTREMVAKIEEAALASAETPALLIEFLDANGKPVAEVAVVPSYVLDLLS